MCRYHYRPIVKGERQKKCKLTKHLPKNLNIPLDKDGLCLFHSKDVHFKKKYNFVQNYLKLATSKAKVDFRGSYFIADARKRNIDYLGDISLHNFDQVEFHSKVVFKKQNFKKSISLFDIGIKNLFFQDCFFENEVTLEQLHLMNPLGGEISFKNCEFDSTLSLEEFNITNFQLTLDSCYVNDSMSLIDLNIKNGFIKSSSTFNLPFSLKNCVMKSTPLDFSTTIFDSEVDITNSKFDDIVIFTDTIVGGKFSIKGDENNKVFYAPVNFDIDTLEGNASIHLEHVDLLQFDENSKKELFDLTYAKRAVIGEGCLKYRHQTQIKEISIAKGFHVLIEEMADTFTSYFISFCKINLGVEIVSRLKNSIRLFYYSDANISSQEFDNAFQDTQFSYLHLLKKETSNESLPVHYDMSDEESFYIRTSLFKIGANASRSVHLGKWKEPDSKALFETITRVNQKIENPKDAHAFVKAFEWKTIESNKVYLNLNIVNQIGTTNVNTDNFNGDLNINPEEET